jgi:PLP dependent protein
MDIGNRIREITQQLPKGTRLLAVSKTKSPEEIMMAYGAGQKLFGENKVQELVQKYQILPKDIAWHMIGHLQTNKVKYIAPFVEMIHSVDSLRLLQVIDKEAKKKYRIIKFLFELHIAAEETKFGLNCGEIEDIICSGELEKLSNVKLVGLMGMATFTDDKHQVMKEFKTIKECFETLRSKYFANETAFCELSIGMSSDYLLAIEYGSTLVRLGSNIFGERL